MKEDLIRMIKEIVDGEKLALDSYFFCGSGSSLPDSELVSSGEAWLKAEEEGRADETAKAKLIERLEAAAQKKPEVLKVRKAVIAETEDPRKKIIEEILAHKDML